MSVQILSLCLTVKRAVPVTCKLGGLVFTPLPVNLDRSTYDLQNGCKKCLSKRLSDDKIFVTEIRLWMIGS